MQERSFTDESSNKRRSVLVVEDEELMLRLVDRFLKRQGFRVLTASDGEQAIEAYHDHGSEIDAVLLDFGLPGIDGLDVVRKIRSEDPDVCIIITSGYLETEMKKELIHAGIKDFVEKPYKLPDVAALLERC
jgi:two-component system cell cycle sensor histidine kinase/response regulator CckA